MRVSRSTSRPLGPRTASVVVAAGSGTRAGHRRNKVLMPLSGRAVLTWAISRSLELPQVERVVVVVRGDDQDEVEATLDTALPGAPVTVITGGVSRHASEWAALVALRPAIERGDLDVVMIHDGARPLATAALMREVVAAAHQHGGALPVLEVPALAPLAEGDTTPGRVVGVQTPQAFRAGPLLAAYTQADVDGFVGTDTASCVERYTDLDVRCVAGDATNLKITFPEDLLVAELLLERSRPTG